MKIMFFSANPPDTNPLDIEAEFRAISDAIGASNHRSSVKLEYGAAADADLLVKSLREARPEIVHFSGHGENGQIALRRGDGYQLIDTRVLVEVLRRNRPRLLFLNCCYSIADEDLLATAADSVIGTTAAIADKVAIQFAGLFYRKLCDGYRVDEAYIDSQNVVAMHQGRHSPFHRLGIDSLRFCEEASCEIPAGRGALDVGLSRKLGSIHLHIDGGRQRRLVNTSIAAHLERGYSAEQSSVIEFIPGRQRETEPDVYRVHTPGPKDGEEELDFFSTTCLHAGPNLPSTAEWQKIKAVTRDVLVQLNSLEAGSPSSGVVMELERVVGTVGAHGDVLLAKQLRLRDEDARDMFEREDLLFAPDYPRREIVQQERLYELHFSLDIPREERSGVAPLSLVTLRTLSEQAGLMIGGWFLFDDKRRWAYRSNGFERTISAQILDASWSAFKQVLDRDPVSRRHPFTLRLIAEETVAVWKSPLVRYPGVYTVPELAQWEATLAPLEEFWVVAPNFLGDQDARVFEAMAKHLRDGVRYVYFLRSNADARRWISFREDLKERLDVEPNMDAYVVEFADNFWDSNMMFIANPRTGAPVAMRLLTDRLNRQIIGGALASELPAAQLIARLESALCDSRMNRCERVITGNRRDVIATVCLRFIEHPVEQDWEAGFDDLLAKQVSASQGQIVRYGGHAVVVLFPGERGALAGAVTFARDLLERIGKDFPSWKIRLGIGLSEGQYGARANGMCWSGEAIHDAKEMTMGHDEVTADGRIALTQRAGGRLSTVIGMKLWPGFELITDANNRYWIRHIEPQGNGKAAHARSVIGKQAATEERRQGGIRGSEHPASAPSFMLEDLPDSRGTLGNLRILGRADAIGAATSGAGGATPPAR